MSHAKNGTRERLAQLSRAQQLCTEFGHFPANEPTTYLTTLTKRQFQSFIANMSDNGEIEVEAVSGYQVLPKDVTDEIGSIKLFNKWSYEDVEIRDISLT